MTKLRSLIQSVGKPPSLLKDLRTHITNKVVAKNRLILIALGASLLAGIYWLLIASDRYVSEAHVIIQRTDVGAAQGMDLSGLLGGGSTTSRADQLILRDHLLSVDMLQKLDGALDLRRHYSDSTKDPVSRMWFRDASIEWFHRHYLSRVSVEYDDYAGVLVITAQAYDPKMAQNITRALVQEGERFMNETAHSLAKAQVTFLESQVNQLHQRALAARRAVIDYQNKKGLASPQATAESIASIVSKLEGQRTELQTQRTSMQAYLVPDHPSIVMINQQLAAVEKQISQEQEKLASTKGNTLNRTVEEYQRLEMDAGFAQDVYKTALVALEKGRVEATRTIKKVSIIQTPTLPQYALKPRRLYNTMVFFLTALIVAAIALLLAAIVRDHID